MIFSLKKMPLAPLYKNGKAPRLSILSVYCIGEGHVFSYQQNESMQQITKQACSYK